MAFLERVDSRMLNKQNLKLQFRVLCYLVAASGRYARSFLKNCVKILIGRKTFFHDADLILRQYALQLIGFRPMSITCIGPPSEGAGSHALSVMRAINFARASGLTYMHTPFSVIRHSDRDQHEWANAWETLFNLGAGERVCDLQRHEVVNTWRGLDSLLLLFGWLNRKDEFEDRFNALIPEFRRKYYLDKYPRINPEVTVAVHVRRGDVSGDHNTSKLFTSTDTIVRTVTEVKAILETHNVRCRIAVHSQGDGAEFAELALLGAELFINADAIWTMQELIEADVLVMAKGCFSYYAGIISDGIKIFEPFYGEDIRLLRSRETMGDWLLRSREPMDDWLVRSADGSFDCAEFEHQLSRLLQANGVANRPIGIQSTQ